MISPRIRSARFSFSRAVYSPDSRPFRVTGWQNISPSRSDSGSSSRSGWGRNRSSTQEATKPNAWFSPFFRTVGITSAP